MEENKKNQDTSMGQEGNQNWDDKNDQRSGGSREPNPERMDTEQTGKGQESNQDWDDQNDKRSSGTHKPNPERFEGKGSAFNENPQATGYGSSQRGEEPNVGPLDSDMADKTSDKREGNNKTGPGLG